MSFFIRQRFVPPVFASAKTLTVVSLVWSFIVLIYLSPLSISSISRTITVKHAEPAQPITITPTAPIADPYEISSQLEDPESKRTLITYVYSETEEARKNFIFFINHGLHSKADFVFIFNGETNASTLLPQKPNINFIQRDNICYDLGSHAEVLTKDGLWLKYGRYILMNASVRGPFMPHWAEACWSERMLSKVTDEVKLVGLSLNCWPTTHVQSMVWATDREGLALLLYPPRDSPRHDEWMETLFGHANDFPRPADYEIADPDWVEKGLNMCFPNRQVAVEAEIGATGIILGAGKKVDVMLMKFQTEPDHVAHCARLGAWDPQGEGAYDGVSIHPFETLFVKTNRGISPRLVELMTEWTDQSNYSSYDYC